MHEQAKINEARYFLNQLSNLSEDRAAFNFNLSAFLAAARSSLQYALEESSQKLGGRVWFDGQVAGNSIVKFFKEKRDISIHREPVFPWAKIEASISENLFVSDSVLITVLRKDGTIEKDNSLQFSPAPISPATESVIT